jgi:hypothetical protein
MPNTIKYSTSGDTQSLKKGNFYIGVGDVPKGPSNTTGHWQGITPPTSGYTIYIDGGVGGVRIMAPDSDEKLVAYANGMNNNTNYVSNGGNFTNGTISPFDGSYSDTGGIGQVVSIVGNLPYSGSSSKNALYLNYNGGRWMGTSGLLTTGVTYTFSFWAKIISGSSFTISWNNQNGSGDTNAWTSSANLTTEWKRYTQTFTYNTDKIYLFFSSRNVDTTRAALFTEFQVITGTTYGGPGLQNATEALNWFSSVSQDEVCVNRDYEPIITNGLILNLDAGYTPSYPRTGTTWYDLAYSGNNGTLTNGPTYNSSNGGSIVFDGVDDFVQCTGSLTLTSATFVSWIKRNGNQTQYDGILFSRGTNTTGMNFFSSNQLGYHWNDAVPTYIWASGLIIPDLTWCMIAVSVTSTSATAYLCQASGITTSTNTTSHASTVLNDIKIAQDDAGSRFFNGNIAISQLYNRALSLTEITQNFNAQKARFGL